jgi:hypothetical protein
MRRTLLISLVFWDFAAYNRISHTDDLFLDVLHLKPAAGNEILRTVLGLEASSACGEHSKIIADSAARLDPSSIDALLRQEERRRNEAASVSSRYSDISSAALRDPTSRQSANDSSPRDLRPPQSKIGCDCSMRVDKEQRQQRSSTIDASRSLINLFGRLDPQRIVAEGRMSAFRAK